MILFGHFLTPQGVQVLRKHLPAEQQSRGFFSTAASKSQLEVSDDGSKAIETRQKKRQRPWLLRRAIHLHRCGNVTFL